MLEAARNGRRPRLVQVPQHDVAIAGPDDFFLLVVNLVYAAFDTFGTIKAMTQGGPGQATETLVVKVYRDGVVQP